MSNFKGAGVALVTPFHSDKSIDYTGLERVIEHIIAGGVDYLVVLGTTGETATLSNSEKKDILAYSIKINQGRVPILYGLGGNSTNTLLEEIKETDFSGVDGILSVSPYYNKPSQEGIIAHYRQVADNSPVPVILYNVPGRTMSNITAESTLILSKHENIIGIKESSGNLEQCLHIAAKKQKDFLLISGDDMMASVIKSIGGEGLISVMGNAYPKIIKALVTGGPEESIKSTFKLLELNPLMYLESNPVGIKCLLKLMNLCGDEVRLPLLKATDALSNQIKKISSPIQ